LFAVLEGGGGKSENDQPCKGTARGQSSSQGGARGHESKCNDNVRRKRGEKETRSRHSTVDGRNVKKLKGKFVRVGKELGRVGADERIFG